MMRVFAPYPFCVASLVAKGKQPNDILHSSVATSPPLLSDSFLLLLIGLSLRLQLLVPPHLHVVLRLHILALGLTTPPQAHLLLLNQLHAKRILVHPIHGILFLLALTASLRHHLLFAIDQVAILVRLHYIEAIGIQELFSLLHLLDVATRQSCSRGPHRLALLCFLLRF